MSSRGRLKTFARRASRDARGGRDRVPSRARAGTRAVSTARDHVRRVARRAPGIARVVQSIRDPSLRRASVSAR